MSEAEFLSVLLYGQQIGTLVHVGGEKSLFSFDDSYINDLNRPTLSLSFKDIYDGLITDQRLYSVRLMPFFSNLLPEGRLREFLAEGAAIHPDREFQLIKALGQDLPGAVRVVATDQRPARASAVAVRDFPAAMESDSVLRFSLAGVQLKFSAIGARPGGLTVPARGIGGDWIVKLPSAHHQGVPENEYSMMDLARQIGIEVPEFALVDADEIANLPAGIGSFGGQAYVVRRFDRTADGGSVHIEDFAQVFGVYPAEKYKKASHVNIARVIAAETNLADLAEFVRRITFNVLVGNGDMHLKNWSLSYPDRRNARLSPAYDLVSTLAYIPGDQSALKFSRSRNFADFTFDELGHLADRAALPPGLVRDTVLETIDLFQQRWNSGKNHLPLSGVVRDAIDRHLATLPILREASAPGITRR